MAVIETKYSVGDVVFHAGLTTERKQHPCPDCKGERKWKAVSPAGSEFSFGCPRCNTRFSSFDDLKLDYTAHVPSIQRLTIGSVQFNSAKESWDSGARYMCLETGVGSGQVYQEANLYATEAEALEAAEAEAAVKNRETEWIVKLYNKTLEISDYQLESAALREASDAQSKARSMLWNLQDLFAGIEEADGKDAILELIDDYKRYSWERDRCDSDASLAEDPKGLSGEAVAARAREGIAQ